LSRAQGDIHPSGNPHVTLDPIRAGEIAVHMAKRLGELDPEHAAQYETRAKAMQDRLQGKAKDWQARIGRSGVKKIVTYHQTLTYFLDRFNLQNSAFLEPKPGIPPTSGHLINVLRIIKEQKIPLVLIENFFDPSVEKKLKAGIPSLRISEVPVLVDGAKGITTIDSLYENLVKTIEQK